MQLLVHDNSLAPIMAIEDEDFRQESKRHKRGRENETERDDKRDKKHKHSRKRSRRSLSPEDGSLPSEGVVKAGGKEVRPIVESSNGEISMSIEETNR